MSLLSFYVFTHEFHCKILVWSTKVGIRTGRWWMYRLQSGNIEGIRGLGYK